MKKIILFVLILLIVIPPFFSGGRHYLVNNSLLIAAGLILLLLVCKNKLCFKKLHYLLLGFLVFSALSLLFSCSSYSSLLFFLQLISGLIIFLVVSFSNFSEKQIRFLMSVILVVAFVLCLVGFFFYLTGHYHRLTSTFYWPNPFAGYLLFILPIGLIVFLRTEKKFLIVPALIVFLTAFVLAGSRGAFLSCLILLGFVFWHQRHRLLKNILWLILIVLFTAGFTWLLFSLKTQIIVDSASFLARETQSSVLDISSKIRLSYWQGALKIFKDNPLFGTGLDSFQKVYPAFQQSPLMAGKYAHNFYLEILAGAGIFAFLFFIAFLGFILFKIGKNIDFKKQPYALAFWAAALGSALHNLVDIDWHWSANLILFCFCLGYAYQVFLRSGNKKEKGNLSRIGKVVLILLTILLILKGFQGLITDHLFTKGQGLPSQELIEQEKFYAQALFLNPNPDIQRALAINLFSQQQYQEAEVLAQKLIKKDTCHALNYQLLGRIYWQKNQFLKAEEQFKQAIKLDPLNQPIYYLDLVKLYLAQNKVKEAKYLTKQILEFYPPEVVKNRKGFILWPGQKITTGIEKDILELQKIVLDFSS